VIPFSIPGGNFFIDVCIKTTEEHERSSVHYGVVNTKTLTDPGSKTISAVQGPESTKPCETATRISEDKPPASSQPGAPLEEQRGLGKPISIESAKEGAANKLDILRAKLKETMLLRDTILNELSNKPFMEFSRRQQLKKQIPLYDEKIKRIKLDIRGIEMISTISLDDLENPQIPKHYQNHGIKRKI
jgi:chemotaxis protein CheX